MLLGYGAKVGLGNMRVKAENRMVTFFIQYLVLKLLFINIFIGTLLSGYINECFDKFSIYSLPEKA